MVGVSAVERKRRGEVKTRVCRCMQHCGYCASLGADWRDVNVSKLHKNEDDETLHSIGNVGKLVLVM